MSEFITYSFPNEVIIHSSKGKFIELSDGKDPNGFVVTDFLHQRVFQFQEVEENSIVEYYSQFEPPIVISPRDYQIEAQALLNSFAVLGVKKAVYSRVKAVPYPIDNAEKLFHQLVNTYPTAFVYLISSIHFGTWIGATPEVLASVSNSTLKTIALAGTKLATYTGNWGEKEIQEHQYVVDAVDQALVRNGVEDVVKDGPKTHFAGPIQHLKTEFSAQISPEKIWRLVMDLHPTPAVCGTPRIAALDLITSREMHERDLYTGIIGIHTPEKSELFVNLRCAQLQPTMAYLYVGGGYTSQSIPDLEWEETENKAKTILDCM